MPKITAPASAHMLGDITSYFGPTAVRFVDGVADLDDLSPALEAYLFGAGYTIDGQTIRPEAVELVDSRDIPDGGFDVGSPLRDAAVDPRPEDFLAPVNAGQADPMGPDVVSPGIHGVNGVLAGPVGDLEPSDLGPVVTDDEQASVQEARESAEAEAVLIEGEPHNADAPAPADADLGPLGLSDPGSVPDNGDTSAPALDGLDEFKAPTKPAQSAPVADWRAYDSAVDPGHDNSEATKATLIAKHADK